jgi:hypothetical protein
MLPAKIQHPVTPSRPITLYCVIQQKQLPDLLWRLSAGGSWQRDMAAMNSLLGREGREGR